MPPHSCRLPGAALARAANGRRPHAQGAGAGRRHGQAAARSAAALEQVKKIFDTPQRFPMVGGMMGGNPVACNACDR